MKIVRFKVMGGPMNVVWNRMLNQTTFDYRSESIHVVWTDVCNGLGLGCLNWLSPTDWMKEVK